MELYNLQIKDNQSFRVFPLFNWIEIDIWQYILERKLILLNYIFQKRPVVIRNDKIILIDDNRIKLKDNEKIYIKM